MPDAIDSLPCSDIACERGGHQRCRRPSIWDDIKREAAERCREEGRDAVER